MKKDIRFLIGLLGILFLAIGIMWSENQNSEEENALQKFRNLRKKQTDFDKWAGKITSNNMLFIKGVNITTIKVKSILLQNKPLEGKKKSSLEYAIIPNKEKGKEGIDNLYGRIQIIECHSITNTHESIIDYMVTCTIPEFPTGESRGLKIGDICFVGANNPPTAVIFARNNILVNIYADIEGLKEPLEQNKVLHENVADIVKDIATQMDNIISCQQGPSHKEIKGIPEIIRFELTKNKAVTNEEVEILLTAKDPSNKELFYSFSTSKGGNIFERNSKYFVIFKEAGNYQISTSVTNIDNLTSVANTQIVIGEEKQDKTKDSSDKPGTGDTEKKTKDK